MIAISMPRRLGRFFDYQAAHLP